MSWQADGAGAAGGCHNRNAFLPFVPEAGKVLAVFGGQSHRGQCSDRMVRRGLTAVVPDCHLCHDTVGAGPDSGPGIVLCRAIPLGQEPGEARHPAASGWVKLEIVLDTREDWRAEWYYNGELVRTYLYWGNPTINYVGFGAMRQAAGQVRNFLLTVEER